SANRDSCTATVTVVDSTAPAITVPAGAQTQYVVGSCGGGALGLTTVPTAVDACQGALPVTCTTVAAATEGANPIPCPATDASGNASHVTLSLVVLPPLTVVVDPPLTGGGVVENRFTAGQVLPHKVRLLDCAQADVTTVASVTVRL